MNKRKDMPRQEGEKRRRTFPRGLVNVLNGTFLTREKVLANMPFLLFVAGLMLFYIGYGYWTERTVRELDRTSSELKEMRSEYITVRSLLERTESQSQVADDISGLGLRESRVPPAKIAVEQKELTKLRSKP
ncbi:MAG: FtsL-like putative cell division protein [Flavobacteriales bacterium]|nr:FtsL-like putative cell division protein [Flavobacteriales bacterium]HRO40088.1 FtsL-like putative cell division protein [Flavobacteriales bacterium]HRP80795.1 FtsL-like putative cell division protein [Flavobacteriales bacterium]